MNDILIVLVVYGQKFENTASFVSILRYNQENDVHSNWIVFDNSSQVSLDEQLTINENTHVHILSSGVNEGLPVNYNKAFNIAEQKGYRYVLLLDQDTELSEGLMPYCKAIEENRASVMVPRMLTGNKQLSPSRYRLGRGFVSQRMHGGIYPFEEYTPLNSGSLIRIDIWKEAGGFNNKIKLDFSDFSFYQRVQHSGIKQFLLIDYDVVHELSTFETDHSKIIIRFGIYMSDMKAFMRECSFFHQLLISFWANIHFVKVLFRTGFSFKVISIYFSAFTWKNVN